MQTIDGTEFNKCPCGTEPIFVDRMPIAGMRAVSITCPVCGLSNAVAYGGETGLAFEEAMAMLADSWNER